MSMDIFRLYMIYLISSISLKYVWPLIYPSSGYLARCSRKQVSWISELWDAKVRSQSPGKECHPSNEPV